MHKDQGAEVSSVCGTCASADSDSGGRSGVRVDTGNPEVKLRWDNTFKLGTIYRLKDPDPATFSQPYTSNVLPQTDDGNRNFNKGFASGRADLLSELDASYGSYGVRFSGAAWYDYIYHQKNDNPGFAGGGTVNHGSVAYNEFTDATQEIMGGKVELLDAFTYGRLTVGNDMPLTYRAGRYAQVWGEAIFFGNNAIASGMVPVDAVKATSVPSAQVKEIIRPVGQFSAQLQVTPEVTVAAYYQFDWERTRIPASGSFLSSADHVGAGNEFFIAPGPTRIPVTNEDPHDQGQYGFMARYLFPNLDLGFYMINYHSKTPSGIYQVGPPVGQVHLVYQENIKHYAVSFNTTQLGTAIAGEFGLRTNAPLGSPPQPVPANTYDNNHNPFYSVGRTLHANLSAFYVLERNPISDTGALIVEAAWNDVWKVTKNRQLLQPYGSEQAVAFRMVFQNTFNNILPGLDLTVPIGASYSPAGRSLAVGGFAVDHGGDLSVGLNFDYLQSWKFNVNYVHFYGDPGPSAAAGGIFPYDQALRDRDFISASIQRTF